MTTEVLKATEVLSIIPSVRLQTLCQLTAKITRGGLKSLTLQTQNCQNDTSLKV